MTTAKTLLSENNIEIKICTLDAAEEKCQKLQEFRNFLVKGNVREQIILYNDMVKYFENE